MKKVDVFVKGPGSGRETAIRSLTAIGLEVGTIRTSRPPRTTVPPAQASSRLTPAEPKETDTTMARYTGPMTKKSRRLGVDLVGGDKNSRTAPIRPASTAVAGSRRRST